MHVVCFPHIQEEMLYIELQIGIDLNKIDYVSVSINLTTPRHVTIKVSDNSLCRPLIGEDGKLYAQYFFQLPIESGKHIVTVKMLADGHLIDIGREVFLVVNAENYLCYIRDQRLCWREEGDSKVSIFDEGGNLIILRGRLKRIWELCDGRISCDDIQRILDIPALECRNLLSILVEKRILSPLNKIKVITREAEYDFN